MYIFSDDLEEDESDNQLDMASNQVGILPWEGLPLNIVALLGISNVYLYRNTGMTKKKEAMQWLEIGRMQNFLLISHLLQPMLASYINIQDFKCTPNVGCSQFTCFPLIIGL